MHEYTNRYRVRIFYTYNKRFVGYEGVHQSSDYYYRCNAPTSNHAIALAYKDSTRREYIDAFMVIVRQI